MASAATIAAHMIQISVADILASLIPIARDPAGATRYPAGQG
jgi:hypothetical protein